MVVDILVSMARMSFRRPFSLYSPFPRSFLFHPDLLSLLASVCLQSNTSTMHGDSFGCRPYGEVGMTAVDVFTSPCLSTPHTSWFYLPTSRPSPSLNYSVFPEALCRLTCMPYSSLPHRSVFSSPPRVLLLMHAQTSS